VYKRQALRKEEQEIQAKVYVEIRNAAGEVVRKVDAPATKGFHRVAWDLRYPSMAAVTAVSGPNQRKGMMVTPGTYTATLFRVVNGKSEQLGDTQSFAVKQLRSGALPAASHADLASFWHDFESAYANFTRVSTQFQHNKGLLQRLEKAVVHTNAPKIDLNSQLAFLQQENFRIDEMMFGNPAKRQVGEKTSPTIFSRLFAVMRGIDNSTYGPTGMHIQSLQLAQDQITAAHTAVNDWNAKAQLLRTAIEREGGPWVQP